MQHPLPDMTGQLRSALRAHWLRYALIALLLFAQHGALVHALTHAGWQAHGGYAKIHASAQQSMQDNGAPGKRAVSLCAFDQVYSQVFGVALDTIAVFQSVAGVFESLGRRSSARSVVVLPPFSAQGPPAYL